MSDPITEFNQDEIKEVINIGASSAATALSQMLQNKPVNITVPDMIIRPIEDVIKVFTDREALKSVVLLKTTGDLNGVIFLVLTPEDALRLANTLTNEHDKGLNVLDDMDRSALKEAGNILSGASLASLAKFLDININHSVPEVVTDMIGSLVSSIVAEFGLTDDKILMVEINLEMKDLKISGELYFLFDNPSTQKIIDSTNLKLQPHG